MKNQVLFSSKDKSKKINVICCNFCLALTGLTDVSPIFKNTHCEFHRKTAKIREQKKQNKKLYKRSAANRNIVSFRHLICKYRIPLKL